MVYVLNVNGQPLMPTDRHGKVKHLLREGKAKVVKHCPFTIQLLYATDNYKQNITLGIDTGSILPITKIVAEVAAFDIQKIKNPDISGIEYQCGEQLDHWNVREYVLFRDGHVCQCCKGKSKDKILEVHHIESRKTGGDAPNNLITLCSTCHDNYHRGIIELPKHIKRGMKFNDATFMGIMRWAFYNRLKETYPDVSLTFGYITKNTRIKNKLAKNHHIDALCITGNPNVKMLNCYYYQRKVRNHNRQLHKHKINKGSIRKSNQAPKEVFGYQLFDRVQFKNKEYCITSRRIRGYFKLQTLDKESKLIETSYKNLRLLEKRKTILTERRSRVNTYIA